MRQLAVPLGCPHAALGLPVAGAAHAAQAGAHTWLGDPPWSMRRTRAASSQRGGGGVGGIRSALPGLVLPCTADPAHLLGTVPRLVSDLAALCTPGRGGSCSAAVPRKRGLGDVQP